MGAGTWSVGRSPGVGNGSGGTVTLGCTTVSGRHAELTVADAGGVRLVDRGSVNGTWVGDVAVTAPTDVGPDDVVRLGAVQVSVRLDDDADHHRGPARGGSGAPTVPFNRPPRPEYPPPDHEIDPPAPPENPSKAPVVGVVAVLAPLVFGAVMVKVFGNLMFGLFTVLGPLMMVGNAIEGRRRGRRLRLGEDRRYRAELRLLTSRLAERSSEERRQLVPTLPDPAEVLRRIERPSTRLWERRPHHADTLRLRAGLGPVPWTPPVRGSARTWAPAVREAVAAAGVLSNAPVEVDLAASGVVGIVGPRPAALAVPRCLVVQAAAHHGPADLPMAVVSPVPTGYRPGTGPSGSRM